MEKSNYSVIVFDLGNVLIPFNYDLFLDKINKIESGLGDRFSQKYKENYSVHQKFERWKLSTKEFLEIMLEWLEHKVTAEEFCVMFSDIFTVNEKTAALLPVLKENYKLVLLSNTNDIHQRYGWEHYDFLKHFDKIVTSHSAGSIKPEPKIYKTVEAFTNRPASEHIFIDDVEEYAEGAKRMGWDAIQFKGYDDLVIELKKRKILLNHL
ncbi:MAG: HAD family phosphatase [Bacteroidetes bacterium]|nr:HAD family phosphatase [Bacteroidota bacterium]